MIMMMMMMMMNIHDAGAPTPDSRRFQKKKIFLTQFHRPNDVRISVAD